MKSFNIRSCIKFPYCATKHAFQAYFSPIFNAVAGLCSKELSAIKLIFLPLPASRSPAAENNKQLRHELKQKARRFYDTFFC